MPTTVLCPVSERYSLEVAVNGPMVQRRTLRLRGGKELVQGHTASKRQAQEAESRNV